MRLQQTHYLDPLGESYQQQSTQRLKLNLLKSNSTLSMRRSVDSNNERSRMKSLMDNDDPEYLKRKIEQLNLIIQLQTKEIFKLKEMNGHLLMSNQSKIDLLYEERKMSLVSNQKSKYLPQKEDILDQKQKFKSMNMRTSTSNQSLSKELPAVGAPKKRLSKLQNLKLEESPAKIQTSAQGNEFSSSDILFNLMQMEECFKISTILNLNLKDSEATDLYENDGTIALMGKIIQDEDTFMDLVQSSNAQKLSFFFDKFKRIVTEHKQLFGLVLRLKKIIKGAQQMSQIDDLDDAVHTIVEQTISSLKCDRATCYIMDHTKNELWSQVSKGVSNTVRVPIGVGLAGYVASKKELLNVRNAYQDNRFNPEIDQKNSYKTKTVLVCPILDRERCLGVLQCINKFEGYFSKDDEALLTILAEFSRVVLTNAINRDEQLLVQNKLRHMIKTGFILTAAIGSLEELIKTAETRLKALMNVQQARVCALSNDRTCFLHINEHRKMQVTPVKVGILGECVKTQKMFSLFNCYSHSMFNPVIDIETQSAIVVLPVYHPTKPEEVIGGIEVVNPKGFATMFQQLSPKLTTGDQEVLEYFCKQLAQSIWIFSHNNLQKLDQAVHMEVDDDSLINEVGSNGLIY